MQASVTKRSVAARAKRAVAARAESRELAPADARHRAEVTESCVRWSPRRAHLTALREISSEANSFCGFKAFSAAFRWRLNSRNQKTSASWSSNLVDPEFFWCCLRAADGPGAPHPGPRAPHFHGAQHRFLLRDRKFFSRNLGAPFFRWKKSQKSVPSGARFWGGGPRKKKVRPHEGRRATFFYTQKRS